MRTLLPELLQSILLDEIAAFTGQPRPRDMPSWRWVEALYDSGALTDEAFVHIRNRVLDNWM
jgi:hypothetical protein